MKVGVLDYSRGGNIYSIVKAVEYLGYDVEAVQSLDGIDKLIIPGVGSYSDGSDAIAPYKDAIKSFINDKPVLGICLGMQLMSQKGFEFGEHTGLGLIRGECVQMNTNKPLPHIGWNNVDLIRDSKLLKDIDGERFYFMHSYEVINYTDSVALSDYEMHKFVSVIEQKNIYGVQFHPEKSGEAGQKLLDNFLKI